MSLLRIIVFFSLDKNQFIYLFISEFVNCVSSSWVMADKLNDLLGRLGKGPRGMGTGLKLLAVAGAAAYGISQSMYTGGEQRPWSKVLRRHTWGIHNNYFKVLHAEVSFIYIFVECIMIALFVLIDFEVLIHQIKQ